MFCYCGSYLNLLSTTTENLGQNSLCFNRHSNEYFRSINLEGCHYRSLLSLSPIACRCTRMRIQNAVQTVCPPVQFFNLPSRFIINPFHAECHQKSHFWFKVRNKTAKLNMWETKVIFLPLAHFTCRSICGWFHQFWCDYVCRKRSSLLQSVPVVTK